MTSEHFFDPFRPHSPLSLVGELQFNRSTKLLTKFLRSDASSSVTKPSNFPPFSPFFFVFCENCFPSISHFISSSFPSVLLKPLSLLAVRSFINFSAALTWGEICRVSYLCRLRLNFVFPPPLLFRFNAIAWPFFPPPSVIIIFPVIPTLFLFVGESNKVAGQCWNGWADDKWRFDHASQRKVLRWHGQMWLMARDVFGRRRLQLKRVEIGAAKGSTSEHNFFSYFYLFHRQFLVHSWTIHPLPTAKGWFIELNVLLMVFFRSSLASSFFFAQIKEESNVLQDGTLIDLCGATLLWRSAEGLQNSPVSCAHAVPAAVYWHHNNSIFSLRFRSRKTKRDLEKLVDEINAGRPQCPVGLNTLVIPRKVTLGEHVNQPYVYLNCGHVQGELSSYFILRSRRFSAVNAAETRWRKTRGEPSQALFALEADYF